jgi:hypothetical protein
LGKHRGVFGKWHFGRGCEINRRRHWAARRRCGRYLPSRFNGFRR